MKSEVLYLRLYRDQVLNLFQTSAGGRRRWGGGGVGWEGSSWIIRDLKQRDVVVSSFSCFCTSSRCQCWLLTQRSVVNVSLPVLLKKSASESLAGLSVSSVFSA